MRTSASSKSIECPATALCGKRLAQAIALLDRDVEIFERPFLHVADAFGRNFVDDQRGVVDRAEVLAQ